MNKSLKIAIYSGVIPSTSFIEQLILTVANRHKVYLFGTLHNHVSYQSERIRIFKTPKQQWKNIVLTLIRSLSLLYRNPKMLTLAWREAWTYKGYYIKWMRFSRFVPVLLHQPDIFHLQWANEINRWTFLKEAYNCKIVVSCLGTLINISPRTNPKLKQMYLDNFVNVDAFQTVSNALAKDLQEFNVPNRKIQTIRSIIPNVAFDYFSIPQEMFKSSIKLVSVGRYHSVKGYEFALETIKQLKSSHNISYTIIAPGQPPKSFILLVNELGLVNTITFVESMSQKELFARLKTFDLMLLPSLSEGIANVALEAMAIGLPVISTDCGGMPELITHNKTGWLVPVKDVKAMADMISEVIDMDRTQLNFIIENAHNHVRKQYNHDLIGQQLDIFYQSVYKHVLEA